MNRKPEQWREFDLDAISPMVKPWVPTNEELAFASNRLASELDAIVLAALVAEMDEELSRGPHL